MTIQATVAALLSADATLVATATGGVWTPTDAGPDGLNRTTTPSAFDASGHIKPSVLVRTRTAVAEGPADEGTPWQAVREMVEVWFYEHDGYETIETMRNRVWALLHGKQLSSTFLALWADDVRNQYDNELRENVERSTFAVRTYKS